MCGIAGWFDAATDAQADGALLERMTTRLAHRGPDGRGTAFSGSAAFGHTRLAIIDLASGDQPMRGPDGDTWITYNGEIFNFRELRRELEARGERFHTVSDTEVILRLYRLHGVDGFARLRGMYAFALWDARRREGWLVRDPMGIKPLFVAHVPGGRLLFASEAKAILAAEPRHAALDEDALNLAMNFRYIPGGSSMFRGVRQLAAGRMLCWREDGSAREQPLASAPEPPGEPSVLEAIQDSVRYHLCADVQVGSYLSGGLDSALITALAVREAGPLPTFTLDVGDDPAEARNAADTAAVLGVTNLRGECSDIGLERLASLVWHLEVPKINALQVSDLARMTAGHVKVALSGLGGDELFLGYNAHRILHAALLAERTLPGPLRRGLAGAAGPLVRALGGPVWSEGDRALQMLKKLGDWPTTYGILRNVWDDPALRRRIYGPRMLDARPADAFETLATLWPRDGDPLAAMVEFEWREKMVNDLLWQEDRASMAEGLEVRVPFVDRVLWARMSREQRRSRVPGGRGKTLLRRASLAVLPAAVVDRPKSGFQVRIHDFFPAHLAGAADALLGEEEIRRHGLFNPDFVSHVRSLRPEKRLRWHLFMLYLMLMTHLWMRAFEGGGAPGPA